MDFSKLFWDRDESIPLAGTGVNAQLMGLASPSVVYTDSKFLQPIEDNHKGILIKGGTYIKLIMTNGTTGKPDHFVFGVVNDLALQYTEQKLDTGTSFRPGKDYYIYMCYMPATETDRVAWADIVISLNSTYPQGFTAETSRKIGGFHTLCVSAGTLPDNPIDGTPHPASGYTAGEIIPNSIWCLTHRSAGLFQEGTAYVEELDEWHWIYLQSGTGVNSCSVFGGTVTKSRTQVQHLDDMLRTGYRLESDSSFQMAADGSNAQTNIQGSADPVTTGGHVDTAGRRMISRYFLEDMCGAYWQWLETFTSYTGSTWAQVPDAQGQTYGTPYAMLAGGAWDAAAFCGPRCRTCNSSRLTVAANCGARGRALSRKSM